MTTEEKIAKERLRLAKKQAAVYRRFLKYGLEY